ncbi:hypothetical protein SGFS_068010 [Streptomyces graminofaciens]|uniref:Pvc16 N-terminal domain-containing protein n=1 Tax=Streptomyces graminofaciens TaxID=68212 RepID=A0ABM7FG11_9ACTN|nr:DUF4255 domain-containing protein [Streptomyces graminofaciens]BBC35507.1 hypothetical protein SGFS_068010 [Streptomyces graminofaciens]
MIHEVDEALRSLLSEEILGETGAEVVFEAPTREWVARRSGAPAVNVFLYDVREDLERRQQGLRTELDDRGRTVQLSEPPRWYSLSYLVTAWTKRPQDEHRLLSLLLAGLVGAGCLAPARLTGSLAELDLTVPLGVAHPPAGHRALADVWSALGGELKPSLDVVVTAPLIPIGRPVAPPVTDGMELRTLDRSSGPEATRRSERRRSRHQDAGRDARRDAGQDARRDAGQDARRDAPDGQPPAPRPGAAPMLGARRVRGPAAGGGSAVGGGSAPGAVRR